MIRTETNAAWDILNVMKQVPSKTYIQVDINPKSNIRTEIFSNMERHESLHIRCLFLNHAAKSGGKKKTNKMKTGLAEDEVEANTPG